MNDYDVRLAFHKRLISLILPDVDTATPDQIFKPEAIGIKRSWRRGTVLLARPQTIGFGKGVYTRTTGIYQIDYHVPRAIEHAMRILSDSTDAHIDHFFPKNGRGLTLIENETCAHIRQRPYHRHLGRETAYLRSVVEVDFFVDTPPED